MLSLLNRRKMELQWVVLSCCLVSLPRLCAAQMEQSSANHQDAWVVIRPGLGNSILSLLGEAH